MDLQDRPGSTALSWREFLRRHRGWLLVGLAVVFAVTVRVRLREMPLERDEGEYAYAGQLILQGVPPYKEAYNMKLPGTYAAYAMIMAVFGQTPSGIRLGLALVNAAAIVLMFRLGRRLLDEAAGVTAAVAFALLSLSPSLLGLSGHATHFVVLAALAGTWFLLKAVEAPSAVRSPPSRFTFLTSRFTHSGDGTQLSPINYPLLLAGLMFGLAFLMKQHGLFFGVFGGLYLLWVRGGEVLLAAGDNSQPAGNRSQRAQGGLQFWSPASRAAWGRLVRDLGWFGLGGLLPYGATCLVLWWAGVLPQFIFWTITYASKYASAISLANGPEMLRTGLRVAVGPNLVFWILPWAGALLMWWEERLAGEKRRFEARSRKPGVNPPAALSRIPRPRFFLIALLFCSVASTSVGLYFREHYFITVLPVLALLTGVAVSRALHLLKHDQTIELFLALPILGAFGIGIGAALIGHGAVWLTLPLPQATRSVFGSTLFADAAQAADYLKSHTTKGARVAVLGSEPEIYFLSGRHSASGHIYMYPLMEEHPYALKMQEAMIGEMERTRPEYVVYVDDSFSWLTRPGSARRILDWWQEYWPANMDLVSTLEVQETQERGTDMDQPTKEAPTIKHLFIFKRRQ